MSESIGRTRLKDASSGLLQALGQKVVGSVGNRVSGLTERLEGVASGSPSTKALVGSGTAVAKGESPVMGAVKGMASGVKDKVTNAIPGLGGKSGGSGSKTPKATKATNFQEIIDVGVPIRVAYNQWTEFGSFPSFMKKVKTVDTSDDIKSTWKAQVFWSSRTWESTILKQVPDERIVWRSKGQKGHVDGTVTFHELTPTLTRIVVVLEYYPQGLFERTGNLWRAQGRRARLEVKHFQRHVMTRTILDPDSVEGWRGTIEDSEVVTTHEEALEQEQQQRESEERESEERESEERESEEQAGGEEPSEEEGAEDEGTEHERAEDEGAEEENSEEGRAERREDDTEDDTEDEYDEEGDEDSDEDDEYEDDEYEDDEEDEEDEESGEQDSDQDDEYEDEEYEEDEDEDEDDDEEDSEDEPDEPPVRRSAQRGAAK
ncbi:SRPBCC family protein [Terrabacter lapilli]